MTAIATLFASRVFRAVALTVFALVTLSLGGSASAAPPREEAPAERSAPPLEGVVNINTATVTQLVLLPGIGEALAQRIVDYRAKGRTFAKVAELARVKGIGLKKVAKLKAWLTVQGETTLRRADKSAQRERSGAGTGRRV